MLQINKFQVACVALLISLTGCSSIGSGWDSAVDFVFGADGGGSERQEKAAKLTREAAGSANSQQAFVDNLMEEKVEKLGASSAAAIDSMLSNSKTDISIMGIKSKKARYFITNVKGFEPINKGHSQTFMQTSLGNANARAVLNVGIGQRYLSDDESIITGLNAFLDYDPRYGHQRASLGGEVKATAFELTANGYKALTKWKSGKSSNQERALGGHDLELGAQVPYMPAAKLYLKKWKWEGEDGSADTKGKTYSIAFSGIVNGVRVELGQRNYDGLTKDENFGQLTYHIPVGGAPPQSRRPIFSSQMFESGSMKDKMLDKVRRNNAIVIQTKFVAGVGGI